ncbi:MAG: hypothetical protein R2830_02230 [Saprospiraceae bacterium]
MSKKKFTDGLESLFSTDPKDVSGKGTAFLRNPSSVGKEGEQASVKRPSSRKTFTTDLDSLLEEALQETFQEQMEARDAKTSDNKAKVFHQQAHRRRPNMGLDMLIRRTVESGAVETDEDTGRKRLTVTFDKEKLIKLKKIARIEKAYLKDILGNIVAEYIKKYEASKGDIQDLGKP